MVKVFITLGVLFSISSAFAEDMYGIFMVVKGDIKIETVAKQQSPAKVGAKVKPTDTIISGNDARARIVMADRNVINISPNTKLVIEKYENNAATGKKDVQLNLLEGKVRNNVEQKYDGDKAKFVLKTPTAVAGIRGTEFMTSFNKATNQTTIVTFKGAVAVTGPTGGPPVMVKKGEMSKVENGKAPEAPKPVPATELKQMDKETSASTSSTKKDDSAGGEKKQADGDKKDGDKKDSGKADASADGGKKDGGSPSDSKQDGKKDSASNDKKGDSGGDKGSRGPASDAGAPPPPPPKMVDSADTKTDVVKGLPPMPASTQPAVPAFVPPPLPPSSIVPVLPPQVPTNVNSKASVIVHINPN